MRPIHTELPAPTGGMLTAKRPTGIIMAFVVIVVAMFAQGIPAIFNAVVTAFQRASQGEAVTPDALLGQDSPSLLISLFSFAMATAVIWLWIRSKELRPFASLGFTAPALGLRYAGRGLLIGIAMISLCVGAAVISGQAVLEWASADATSVGFIFVILLGFMVQGSTEEILTRGYLTQAVARRWGLVAAVIIQAAFFTLLHGFNNGIGVLPIVNLTLFALFGSFLSLSEGGLWGICAIHGIWNWAQGNLFGVAVSGNQVADTFFTFTANPGSTDLITGGSFGIEGSLVTSVVLVLASLIALRSWQKKRRASVSASANSISAARIDEIAVANESA